MVNLSNFILVGILLISNIYFGAWVLSKISKKRGDTGYSCGTRADSNTWLINSFFCSFWVVSLLGFAWDYIVKLSPILRINALITRRRLVVLKDFDGEETLSIAYTDKDFKGVLLAYRWWPFHEDLCILQKDGSIEGPYYVKSWRFRSNS